ncbi:MAG: response regulator [Betaproteobacteria bacterium]|jgi:two-component system OmpR family response regulator|nr:response regulator [Rubrivivax sp.]
MRVLYVDDDRINALLFEETVRFAPGVEIEVAATGAEAVDLARRWPPDLLVVDLHLPDTDGLQLLPHLRRAAGRADLPAYLCTADDAPERAREARAAGYVALWPKPVDLGTVIDELKRRSDGAAGP